MQFPPLLARIFSQFYKNLHGIFRNHFRLADVFLWPIIYLFTLSFFISYAKMDPIYLNIIVLGMIGWRAIYFMSAELVSSYMEDYWSKSLALLHISPISRFEFALGSSLSGLFKTLIVIVLYFLVASNLYSFSIVHFDLFLIGLLFLIMCGFSLGLLVLGLTYENRESSFSLSFLIPDVVALISGVYFSISEVFPPNISSILNYLPTVHAFNAIKSASGFEFTFDLPYLFFSSILLMVICERINLFFYLRAKKSGKLGRFG
jgi:hypothetical protein